MMAVGSGQFSAPFLTDAELTALDDLVHDGRIFAYVLYVSGFRRRMDWRTRTVGMSADSVVSLAYLQQCLERQTKAGSHWRKKRPTVDQVRGEITALERVGLLTRLAKPDRLSPMRFRLDFAPVGSIRLQEEPQEEPQRGTPSANPHKHYVSGGMNPKGEALEEPHITYIQQQQGGNSGFSFEQLRSVDLDLVISIYHELLPGLPKVRAAVEAYRLMVARVWFMPTEPPGKYQKEKFWRGYFAACRQSDFLMGRVTPNQRRGPFRANFKTLVDQETVIKVINGEYT